jgi:hypothetical protein
MVAHDEFSSSYHREAGFACEMGEGQLPGLSFDGGGWCQIWRFLAWFLPGVCRQPNCLCRLKIPKRDRA